MRSRRSYRGSRRYRSTGSSQGVFGGQIMSVAEVQALAKSIKAKEAAEFEAFEKMFDADLRNL